MEDKRELQRIIAGAYGTSAYHEYSNLPFYPVITDGVLAVADAAECFWLLDIIGSYQTHERLTWTFQVWILHCSDDGSGVITGYNDTVKVIEHCLEHIDFPLETIKLYLIDGVLLLPSEY